MKNLILAAFLSLTSTIAFSQVIGSKFEDYQQNLIAQAVADQCGIRSDLVQISHTEYAERVDNGVIDVYMTTEFQARLHVDQYAYDNYLVTINSVLASGYDHENQVSGLFSVLNLTCQPN